MANVANVGCPEGERMWWRAIVAVDVDVGLLMKWALYCAGANKAESPVAEGVSKGEDA